jgi:hypothetical protein
MHGSRNIIPNKNLIRQHCMEGFNSGIKGLIFSLKSFILSTDSVYVAFVKCNFKISSSVHAKNILYVVYGYVCDLSM